MAGRVQVSDLAPAERLQPSGIQRDTFEGAAQPVIDNNLERLSQSLGAFSSSVVRLHNRLEIDSKKKEAEDKKAFLTQAQFDHDSWVMATTSDERIKAYKDGRAPWQFDPIAGAVVQKHWGQEAAKDFASRIQADLMQNQEQTLKPGWNPERYIVEQTAKYIEDGRFRGSPFAVDTFQKGVASVTEQTSKWHQGVLSTRAQQSLDLVTNDRLEARFKNAVEMNLSPEDYVDYYREEYKDLGPRKLGGTLDQSYAKMDEIQIKLLDRMAAQNPAYADMAKKAMAVSRLDPVTGQDMGSFVTNPKTQDAALNIMAKADKTVALFAKKEAETKYLDAVTQAVLNKDGSIHALQDLKADFGSGVSASMSKDKAIETATLRALQIKRKEIGGINLGDEIELVSKSNVPHPELVPLLQNEAVSAVTQISVKGQEQNAVQRFATAGDQYGKMYDVNPMYARTQIKGIQKEMYDTYTTLVRDVKYSPAQASQMVLQGYSQRSEDDLKKADYGNRDKIESAVKGLDLNGWKFGGSEGSWIGASLQNGGQLRGQVLDQATVLMRVTGMNAETAIKASAKRIEEQSLFVNGRAIYGVPGFNPGDGDTIGAMLRKQFNDNKEVFQKEGITDPSQLSLSPSASGASLVVHADSNLPIQSGPMSFFQITPEEVQRAGGAFDAATTKYAREQILKNAEKKKPDAQGRPPTIGAPDRWLREQIDKTPSAKGLGDIIRQKLRNE